MCMLMYLFPEEIAGRGYQKTKNKNGDSAYSARICCPQRRIIAIGVLSEKLHFHIYNSWYLIIFVNLFQTSKTLLSPSKLSRLVIKMVSIISASGTAFVVDSPFQRPLFSFHVNSIESQQLSLIAFIFQVTVRRQSSFSI